MAFQRSPDVYKRQASASSSITNGDGLTWSIANNKHIAVKAFSPPLKDTGEFIFLPGGIAIISIPVSVSYTHLDVYKRQTL